MYTPDLTIGTTTYSLQAQRTNSSVRSDATQPLSEPNLLTISHETAKNGSRSSVVIFDDAKVVSNSTTNNIAVERNRVMFKAQFNPKAGRTDIDTCIRAQIAELIAFLGVEANITKLLNMES